MPQQWNKHDDNTLFVTLGGVLTVAIIYDQVGKSGWKIQVGKRAMRDKIASKEDAQKVALAFAHRILKQCGTELEEFISDLQNASGESS